MADRLPMVDKLWFILPEVALFLGVVVIFIMGLSHSKRVRDMLPMITCLSLAVAFGLTWWVYEGSRGQTLLSVNPNLMLMPMVGKYVKMSACAIGIILAMVSVGSVDRRLEAAVAAGHLPFDPIRANRGEFYAFFLLSLMGVMLTCNANDLIWLFLALELTSLPTYIMVAISRPPRVAQEAAVKYFFLGAMATAIFLYGFALLYGSTGTMILTEMQRAFAAQAKADVVNSFGIIGMILAMLGICFKIAAAPMHFYAADVYEGAAAPVTAFLAFVPKTAGMVAIILLLTTLGWSGHPSTGLPEPIMTTLWMIAVLTMTLGNLGALLQRSVKRILAYSSIAHSGYMLIGVIAGPANNGINAVLFYLLVYGIMNTAAFAVLAALERRGQEIETMEDLAGLRIKHPGMAVVMAIASGSLLGVPPLLGFFAKLYLFIAGIQAGQIVLVVIAGLNTAISAWYYLGLVTLPIMAKPSAQSETIVRSPFPWPRIAGIVTAVAVVVLPLFLGPLIRASQAATTPASLTTGVTISK
ncbi:MAG: NADH-quinone oxidoreductase subunit N [Phycisphaerales bacterium]|nr:NADH-quinone oxidoreductase subunit N [Phycisphaerales bacterium]MCI0632254.1 NADH-quinone oxidoreductase subunit N [Phycisphaerales bacterium]MCI0676962.1 NADH-quinone oxidoreductase subunit N [Phycisphaerales bacterium]